MRLMRHLNLVLSKHSGGRGGDLNTALPYTRSIDFWPNACLHLVYLSNRANYTDPGSTKLRAIFAAQETAKGNQGSARAH